jgi:LytS/YehU family sensor histidine kinase
MQARVEPELLFGALQRVGELAGTAASERADRLLDELIALLRLLMPDGSGLDDGDGTTVEHELATAVAYLRVHDACAGAAREIEIAIAPEAAAQALPPMLTLTIARMIVRREAAVRAPLRIRAGCADGTLTLDFARNDDDDAKPLIDQSDLVDLRRRLDKSFGTDTASLATADSAATLTLRLPLRP